MVWWLAPSLHKRVPGLNPGWGLSVRSLHVLPDTCKCCIYSDSCVLKVKLSKGFLPPPKNMHVRLIGDYKLTLGVSVSFCLTCLCVTVWRTGDLFRVYPASRPML